MKTNINNFNRNSVAVDEFFNNALFNKKKGYYSTKNPFGKKGDFVTAPNISDIFWDYWNLDCFNLEKLGKPKKINLVELGPGDGSMAKILIRLLKDFLNFIPL